jgi:UDP-glucose 4-epimerase
MRILITGKNSFIGNSLKNFLKSKNEYLIDEISLRNNNWKSIDFKTYDVIIHLAALVHEIEIKFTLQEYEKVNVDLTLEIARKALNEGVSHFIFFSTMAVFGKSKIINRNTPLVPITKYGITKLNAEKALSELLINSRMFLTILRPPMIYGLGAKGNPKFIEKISNLVCFFPETNNRRSFLSIDNLNALLVNEITNKKNRILHPQDPKQLSTFELFRYYRTKMNKHSYPMKVFGFLLKKFLFIGYLNKIFGDLYYNFYD